MGWQRVEIGGRPADVLSPSEARFAVLHLRHLDDALPSPELTAAYIAEPLVVVAPLGGGSGWLDAEDDLLSTVIPWAMSSLAPKRMAAAGVGTGGHAAIRLGFRHPTRLSVVASLDAAFDLHDYHGRGTPLDDLFDTRERLRQQTAILQVNPAAYPSHVWFGCEPASPHARGNDRLHEKLSAYGLPHTFAESADPAAMAAFVRRSLESDAMRLL